MEAVPQEIVDSIIELCKDSTDDLKNCSIVSTSWTPASRRHLFHTITLGGVRRVVRFRNQDAQLPGARSFLQQFQQLDEFLEKAPYVAEQCIRCVKLRFEWHVAAPTAYGEEASFMLGKVLGRLAQVQEFYLSLGRWASYPREAKRVIYSAIRQPSVLRLSVRASEFDSFPDLASLLIHSPGLKHLAVADLVVHESTAELENTSDLSVHLESLRIDTQIRYLVPAFLDSAFPIEVDNLRQLRLSLTPRREACELINQLIEKAGTFLLHLELSDTLTYQVTPDSLKIILIPNLRSVHFNGFKVTSFSSSLPWIVKAFSHVGSTSSPLEDVSICAMAHRRMLDETSGLGSPFLWTPCRQLDGLLAGPGLPLLRSVKFSLTVREPEESSLPDFDRKIRESFTAVSARPGTVLEVSVGSAHADGYGQM